MRCLPSLICVLLCAVPVLGQDEALQRIRKLEAELEGERERGRTQARRIQQLELSMIAVLDRQEKAPTRDAERLDGLIREIASSEVAAALKPVRSSALTVRGTGRFVHRSFGKEDITTDQSFELEHLIVEMTYRADEDLHVKLTPGVSHRGAVFILEAAASYEIDEWLEVTVGRFLVPFNGIHAWAFPSDSFIEPYLGVNSPKPFMYGPWWDEGAMARGSFAFGAEDEHAVHYAVYVVNGFDALGLDGVHKRNIGDNNENKTVGFRVSTTLALGDGAGLSIGLAGMAGKYDAFDDLGFWALELDVELRLGDFKIYLEVFHRESEIAGGVVENPMAQITDVARLTGFKVRPQLRLTERLTVFAQLDLLCVSQAPRDGAGDFSVTNLDNETFTVLTAILGLRYDINAHVRVGIEGGIFDRDADLGGDIPFLAVSFYFYF